MALLSIVSFFSVTGFVAKVIKILPIVSSIIGLDLFDKKTNSKEEVINKLISDIRHSMKDKLKENFVESIDKIVEEKTIIYEKEINEKISLIENIISNNDEANIGKEIEKYNSQKNSIEVVLKKI